MTCGSGSPIFEGSPPPGSINRLNVSRSYGCSISPRPLFGHHGSACGSLLRSSRSERCCRRLLHTKCAGRSCPWLCPPVATGSTWSAVKLMGSGCFSILSIGLLQSQQTGFGCAIRRSRRRLYSGSLVRLTRCLIAHQLPACCFACHALSVAILRWHSSAQCLSSPWLIVV